MESTRVPRRTVLAATLAGITAATTLTTATAGPAFAAEPTGSISGVVRDTAGQVVSDAYITVYPATSVDPVQELLVDTDGRFAVTDLKPGGYNIAVGLKGWSEWAPGRIENQSQAKVYQVTANRDTVANSVITAPGFIAGRFFGPDGKPAANVGVEVTDVDSARQYGGLTESDGTYRVRVQPNRTFKVAYGVGPLFEYVPHTFDPAQATRFLVRSAQTVRVDDRAVPLAGISGRLTDAAGAPAGFVYVTITNVDTINTSEKTTAADGTYDFSGLLAPGKYKVQFSDSGRSQYAPRKPDYASAKVFTLTSGRTTVVDDQLLWVPTAR